MLALVWALATSGGCGLADPAARGHDLGQVLHVGLGGSWIPGLHAWALGPLLGTGLGYTGDSTWVGSDYGYTHVWNQSGYGVLLGGETVRGELGFPVADFWDRPVWDAYLTQTQFIVLHLIVTDQRLGNRAQAIALRRAEAGVHLLFVGASLGLDLVHLFDALVGFFGFDPSEDDHEEPPRAPFPRPEGLLTEGDEG